MSLAGAGQAASRAGSLQSGAVQGVQGRAVHESMIRRTRASPREISRRCGALRWRYRRHSWRSRCASPGRRRRADDRRRRGGIASAGAGAAWIHQWRRGGSGKPTPAPRQERPASAPAPAAVGSLQAGAVPGSRPRAGRRPGHRGAEQGEAVPLRRHAPIRSARSPLTSRGAPSRPLDRERRAGRDARRLMPSRKRRRTLRRAARTQAPPQQGPAQALRNDAMRGVGSPDAQSGGVRQQTVVGMGCGAPGEDRRSVPTTECP